MEITFADGTKIQVAASALDDFLKHDLKWVEYVHGRAADPKLLQMKRPASSAAKPISNAVRRCPAC